jgi:hypothetical protein
METFRLCYCRITLTGRCFLSRNYLLFPASLPACRVSSNVEYLLLMLMDGQDSSSRIQRGN